MGIGSFSRRASFRVEATNNLDPEAINFVDIGAHASFVPSTCWTESICEPEFAGAHGGFERKKTEWDKSSVRKSVPCAGVSIWDTLESRVEASLWKRRGRRSVKGRFYASTHHPKAHVTPSR